MKNLTLIVTLTVIATSFTAQAENYNITKRSFYSSPNNIIAQVVDVQQSPKQCYFNKQRKPQCLHKYFITLFFIDQNQQIKYKNITSNTKKFKGDFLNIEIY